MKDRVLKLCKRLDKFSYDDILTIAEDINEATLELLILTLVNEERLILRDGVYYYNKPVKNKQISTFQYFSKQTIELVVRCFCIELTAEKTALLSDISEHSVFKLYNHFRELLFLHQKDALVTLYGNNPKKVRIRKFFKNKKIYLYIYNSKVFVSNAPLTSPYEKLFTDSEVKEFKKVCCYLSRIKSHNKNEVNLYYRIAEALWRRNRSFEKLFNDLKVNLLNLS